MALDIYGNPRYSEELPGLTALTPLPEITPTAVSSLTDLVESIRAPKLPSVPDSGNVLPLLLNALSNREAQTLGTVGLDAASGSTLGGGTPAQRASQKLLLRGQYAVPAQGRLIGSPYAGTHSLGNWESDNAVDISIPEGTPIRAAADGTVGSAFGALNSSNPRMAGLRLHLNTKDNEFYYAHLSAFAPGIKPGAKVKRGQIIGYSGSANGSPHLHLGVRSGDPRGLYSAKPKPKPKPKPKSRPKPRKPKPRR